MCASGLMGRVLPVMGSAMSHFSSAARAVLRPDSSAWTTPKDPHADLSLLLKWMLGIVAEARRRCVSSSRSRGKRREGECHNRGAAEEKGGGETLTILALEVAAVELRGPQVDVEHKGVVGVVEPMQEAFGSVDGLHVEAQEDERELHLGPEDPPGEATIMPDTRRQWKRGTSPPPPQGRSKPVMQLACRTFRSV